MQECLKILAYCCVIVFYYLAISYSLVSRYFPNNVRILFCLHTVRIEMITLSIRLRECFIVLRSDIGNNESIWLRKFSLRLHKSNIFRIENNTSIRMILMVFFRNYTKWQLNVLSKSISNT